MSSARETMEDIVLLAQNDEELVLFDEFLHSKNRVYHYLQTSSVKFDLNKLNNDYCWHHFRFYKADIKKLRQLLAIPEVVHVRGARITVSGEEGLCIMLKRLAYPSRYKDLMQFFPWCTTALSRIFNHMVRHILTHKGHLLNSVDHSFLSEESVKGLSGTLNAKGSPFRRCVGFLDGTVRAICRPSRNQREYYNGHKRVHALKFQSLMIPNGIIANLYGPVKGRRHDAHLLAKSMLLPKLEQKFANYQHKPYIYGDPAYPLRPSLMVPFKGSLNHRQRHVNRKMSKIRESVEWGFCKVLQLWGFVDFKKNLKILHQPVADYYKVAVILTNCHTALYQSQVSEYFECVPPTLDEYLSL